MANVISSLLSLMRVRSTLFVGKNISAPWSVQLEDHGNLVRFHLVVSGHTYLRMRPDAPAHRLDAGDLAIIPNGTAHIYSDTADRPVERTLQLPVDGAHPYFAQLVAKSADTHLLCGFFRLSESTPPALAAKLPEILIERGSRGKAGDRFVAVLDLSRGEVSKKDPSPVVLNRLTELLCIYAMESWLEREMSSDEHLRALIDPKIIPVLDAIHDEPSKDWTVESLARIYGQSRTAFAERFKAATGVTPIGYVRRWRIGLARTMLEQNDLPLDEIAFKAGYADTNAFNRAFKRETGSTPGSFKRGVQQ